MQADIKWSSLSGRDESFSNILSYHFRDSRIVEFFLASLFRECVLIRWCALRLVLGVSHLMASSFSGESED